ncbi:MAG TPA: pilus assembly protein PilP [Nitrospira sp.]|nr:pilus assembly protein PilP [Nitrospira sp.]
MNQLSQRHLVAALFGCAIVVTVTGPVASEPGLTSHFRQVTPLRQDSVRVPAPADLSKEAAQPSLPPSPAPFAGATESMPGAPAAVGGYDPAGRRDPFAPVLSQLAPGQADLTLPPLQRVNLTDMNLIAIIWGAYGYTAMVQTPDGNGYSVRKGTRVGPNAGVVSAVTEKGIIVQERFTDVYGRKQEREYVKLLHPKEGLE